MASSAIPFTYIPHPLEFDGGPPEDDMRRSYPKPVYTVVDASQLPNDFLSPSPDKKLVIGFDCETLDLCDGPMTLMQLAFPDAIYLVDIFQGGRELMRACKPALESGYILKVIHDCQRDSRALLKEHGIMLNNVWDTQLAYSFIEQQEGRNHGVSISFASLIADPRYCGIPYPEKEAIITIMKQTGFFWTYNGDFWSHRPYSDLLIRVAVDDEFWPPLPPPPAGMEAEVVSTVYVLIGHLRRIIDEGGEVAIRSLTESCNAEIIIDSSGRFMGQIYVIGPPSEVSKAVAIFNGKLPIWK